MEEKIGLEKTSILQLEGDGTKDNPYLISSADTFLNISNNLAAFYRLEKDIDFVGTALTPIGSYYTPFTGGLDGAGHAVRNLVATAGTYAGLFGSVSGAELINLMLEGVQVTASNEYAGMLAGHMRGGIVSGCCAAGSVEGKNYAGGLIGHASENASVRDSYARGSVAVTGGGFYGGGLVGYSINAVIQNSYAACSFSGIRDAYGLAYVSSSTSSAVVASYYDSQVSGCRNDEYNVGKLTSGLTGSAFFETWDFEDTWDIVEGKSYPYLKCMGKLAGEAIDLGFIRAGAGTEENPYQVENLGGLNLMRKDLAGRYRLMADMDLAGENLMPIGSQSAPFTGGLDGAGHAVRNLVVTTDSYAGLFGSVSGAELINLMLEGMQITASNKYAGMLAGDMRGGSVRGCCAAGSVEGNNNAGGLIGHAWENALVRDSYARGSVTVTGGGSGGGLVGYSENATIQNSYAACSFSGSVRDVRGLTYIYAGGTGIPATVEHSYYDSQVAGYRSDGYNVGKLTSGLTGSGFLRAWDFEDTWAIAEGESYPYLRCMGKLVGEAVDLGFIRAGAGTEENPYQVENLGGLNLMRKDLAGRYRLMSDIDLAGDTLTPTGSESAPFTGGFDGAGHAVRNFVVNTDSYAGLFGAVRGGELKNLMLESVQVITSSYHAGMLAGDLREGSVIGCCAAGSVEGSGYAGGLIGYASENASVRDSYARGSVAVTGGHGNGGGLVGYSENAAIQNSYAACSFSGGDSGYVYGLAYVNKGGTGDPATVKDSYYDSQVAGYKSNEYNVGKLTSGLTGSGFLKAWDFEGTWAIAEGESYPYLRCMGKMAGEDIDLGFIRSGAGTEEDPYRVENAGGLNLMRNDLAGRYRLTADIDLAGEAVTPTGSYTAPFTGGLDGAGHTVRNLVVNTSGYAGLFGYAGGAALENLMLDGAQVTASYNYAGMLAGYIQGGIVNGCCAAGSVKGNGYTGGLVGYAEKNALVRDSYARGSVAVTGRSGYGGGLVGYSINAAIQNSYAACTLSESGNGYIYGLVCVNAGGTGDPATVKDSYYDSQVAGCIGDEYNVGKLTSGLTDSGFLKTWDFEDTWAIAEGESYPYLKCMGKLVGEAVDLGFIRAGAGTEEDPYQVENLGGLNLMRNDLAGRYLLTADIDLAGEALTPTGSEFAPFSGGFDGAGHAVKNLVVNTNNEAGLFGAVRGAALKNLMLEGAQVTALLKYAGMLAGHMRGGSVSGCCAAGNVKGKECVGGLVGYASENTLVRDSYAQGSVTVTGGGGNGGGLVGYSEYAAIQNSYAACSFNSDSSYVYGLTYVYKGGTENPSTVEASYYDSQLAGYKSNEYNVGKLTSGLAGREFFKAWDFEDTWDIEEGKSYPYLKCMGKLAGDAIDLGFIRTGAGTEENPYQVENLGGLNLMRNDLAGWYRLTVDIDLAGETLTPTGSESAPFTGSFDGAGHAVRSLVVKTLEYAGLFGAVRGAALKNLMLEGVQVTVSSDHAGMLAGDMRGGSVSGCCAEGSVKGNQYVGGLIGYASENALVRDSYARGSVTVNSSGNCGGGLVGFCKNATIQNSYAACSFNGNSGNVYGLACVNEGGTGTPSTVKESYYDSQVAGYRSNEYNVGKLTSGLADRKFFKAWDFEDTWDIAEGRSYPYLKCMGKPVGEAIDLDFIRIGAGTEENPYQVENIGGLNLMTKDLAGWYRLTADIDLAGEALTPTGSESAPFSGGFDGAGHAVRNLVVNTRGYAGLFGAVRGAALKNLMLEGAHVMAASYYAGMLAGHMRGGSVSGCCAEGSVEGSDNVGGLVGYASENASVRDSYARGSVTVINSGGEGGGLVGYSRNAVIQNSYAACGFSGNGSKNVYGLVCVNAGGTGTPSTVEASYYDSQVAGYRSNEYNVGKLTSGLTGSGFLETWDFEDTWDIAEGRSYPYLKCIGKLAGAAIDLGFIHTGAGTEENPYHVEDAGGLSLMKNDLAGWYRLTADIDLAGETLTPTGSESAPFTGGLDGAGHAVRNFVVNTNNEAGLFGAVKGAALKNLMLEGTQVTTSSDHAGMLAGDMQGGSVSGCCAAGSVEGNNYAGGLIGYASENALVRDSYARGSVTVTRYGGGYGGGLVGYSKNTAIQNSYAACSISGSGNIYGLAYVNAGGTGTPSTVEASYYDSQVAGYRSNEYNVGKLTSGLTGSGFLETWDFEDTWDIAEGRSYPYLRCMGKLAGAAIDLGFIHTGVGTKEDPYHVENAGGLNLMKNDLAGWYCLTTDIDLAGETLAPTGSESAPFTGGLDGAGHAVRNLVVNTSGYAGLFGYAGGATLKNLMLEGAQITASYNYAGMLAGYMQGGSVNGCCAAGSVKGNEHTGGLIGYASENASIRDSYARGSVTVTSGGGYGGGLVGYSKNTAIQNSYAACSISGSGNMYGLAYVNAGGTGTPSTVEASYYDSQVAGYRCNEYNVGKLTSSLAGRGFLKDWDFEDTWDIAEGRSYPYLRCMGKLAGAAIDPGFIHTGAGTEEDPYQVENAGGLSLMKNDLAGWYCLTTDIDLAGETLAPTGSESAPFTGGLDGAGHEIRNLVITASSYAGLFGYAKDAEFGELILKDAQVSSAGSYTGALAAYMENCTVRNISQTSITINGGSYTGAMSGYIKKGSIMSCSARENILVTGTSQVGGLAGTITDISTVVKECCTAADVTGRQYVGGIAGLLECSIVNSYASGSVSSTSNFPSTGGLAGVIRNGSITNCYTTCSVSRDGYGLANLSSAAVVNSFFNSDLAEITTPAEQARTTGQMLHKETYIGWDWENIWDYKENFYPGLRNIEFTNQEPFELTFGKLTHFSVVIEWQDLPGAKNYQITYLNKKENVTASRILIEELAPETEYEFRVCALNNEMATAWSKILKIKTKKIMSVSGIHSIGKGTDTITLAWNPADLAEAYEVKYNGCIQSVNINECTLVGLDTEIPYVIRVKALLSDGCSLISDPIMEKIYHLDPQTDYAKEFIDKCEEQTWFIDEIENLLNLKGKTVNTIQSKEDFAAIYAIGLAGRGISGKLPAAIGELYQLEYLFLANNKLDGKVPDELSLLEHLVEADFTGNQMEM